MSDHHHHEGTGTGLTRSPYAARIRAIAFPPSDVAFDAAFARR